MNPSNNDCWVVSLFSLLVSLVSRLVSPFSLSVSLIVSPFSRLVSLLVSLFSLFSRLVSLLVSRFSLLGSLFSLFVSLVLLEQYSVLLLPILYIVTVTLDTPSSTRIVVITSTMIREWTCSQKTNASGESTHIIPLFLRPDPCVIRHSQKT